jgi:hypothetical protein
MHTGEHENERRFKEALRALLPLGFDKKFILSTIQHLLEVIALWTLGFWGVGLF